MKTITSLLSFSLLSFFLISCNSSNQAQEESNGAGLHSYEYKTFKTISTKPLDGLDTTYFAVTYPKFSDATINAYVQEHLVLDSGKSSVEEMGQEFIMDYDRFYDEVEFKRPWYEERRDSVKVQTESYIGFSIFYSAYTGGAHGNYYILFTNYDVEHNKEFVLGDIVHSSNNELTLIAEKIFRDQEGISETHSLSDGYFFDDGIFSLPNNFILQEDGILFLYNIYEIKPYVSGDTRLLIPYTSIEDILTDKGKEIIAEIQNI